MGCPWDAHGMPMGCPWAVGGLPMVDHWFNRLVGGGPPMGCPWAARGLPVGCPWVVCPWDARGTVSNPTFIEKTNNVYLSRPFAGDPEGCYVGRAWHGRAAARGGAREQPVLKRYTETDIAVKTQGGIITTVAYYDKDYGSGIRRLVRQRGRYYPHTHRLSVQCMRIKNCNMDVDIHIYVDVLSLRTSN